MKFTTLTLFPEFIESIKGYSIIRRAIENGLISVESINIRDFAINKHGQVDDYPYGGGQGMVMMVEPVYKAIESVKTENSHVVFLSPQGKVLNQKIIKDLSKKEHIVLLCGHYEGIDERIIENYIDEEISIGDYVLTGGEIPAMVLIDSVSRMIDGVLASSEAYEDESHMDGLLEYPQYTRPQEFMGLKVPDVLLSGNHQEIEKYRREMSILQTKKKRPDLFKFIKDKKEGGS
ncbi:MAG: tRNA (guanosine(37)-N1)-methyltransferase TrmD [Peptoniphilus duerdenii]|uniref:tRNA (guanosine(37)-N1)-methyltransferase TrmD n=1 Tax=Peptoniphilus duerdenii TaxID=507750 RepID=UPI00254D75C9|nr:tRNA (guanosine(37)-N1)-methyltransferase TrmD [Peptoniphilus duerdenii]MDK8275942.1 tRNA (guanosine(37)-N1)-methyltransferase TrmD [Peptoniphilus duerdenii]